MPKAKEFILLLLILAVILISVVIIQKKTTIKIYNPVNITTSVLTLTPTPSPKAGYKRYANNELRFGFDYPVNEMLRECTDLMCASIDNLSFQLEVIQDLYYEGNLVTNCTASGPGGKTKCKDFKTEAYTNPLRVQGSKIFYTQEIASAYSDSGTYQGVAYGFPLSHQVKTKNGGPYDYYEAVLLMVYTPTPANLTALEKIANSFYTF